MPETSKSCEKMRDLTKKYFHLNSSAVYNSSAKNTEPCHTNPGLILGILGTWQSYSKVVHLASKVHLRSQKGTEINNVINSKVISKLKIVKTFPTDLNFFGDTQGTSKN